MKDENKEKWKIFKGKGLLWWINMQLHLFGYAIKLDVDNDGNVLEAYPDRVKYRGFSQESNDRGYMKVAAHMKEISDELENDITSSVNHQEEVHEKNKCDYKEEINVIDSLFFTDDMYCGIYNLNIIKASGFDPLKFSLATNFSIESILLNTGHEIQINQCMNELSDLQLDKYIDTDGNVRIVKPFRLISNIDIFNVIEVNAVLKLEMNFITGMIGMTFSEPSIKGVRFGGNIILK